MHDTGRSHESRHRRGDTWKHTITGRDTSPTTAENTEGKKTGDFLKGGLEGDIGNTQTLGAFGGILVRHIVPQDGLCPHKNVSQVRQDTVEPVTVIHQKVLHKLGELHHRVEECPIEAVS